MNALDQIDEIKSEARLEIIKRACQKLKGKTRPSFSSMMHKIAEKEDHSSNILQSVDVAIDTFMQSDLAAENMREIFG